MTFDDAVKVAKANPGQGIRDASFSPKWKVVWINWPKNKLTPAGGDLFCINPITGGDYRFNPTAAHRSSTKWTLT